MFVDLSPHLFVRPDSTSSVPVEIQKAAALDEQARVENAHEIWNGKLMALSPGMYKACKKYLDQLTNGLLNDVKTMSSKTEVFELRHAVTEALGEFHYSMERHCSAVHIEMDQRKINEAANKALNTSIQNLSLQPAAVTVSFHPQQSTPIWGKAQASVKQSAAAQPAQLDQKEVHFSDQPALNTCLEGRLDDAYLKEKGVTRAFADHFAGQTYARKDVRPVVNNKLLYMDDKIPLREPMFWILGERIEGALIHCSKEGQSTLKEAPKPKKEVPSSEIGKVQELARDQLLDQGGVKMPAVFKSIKKASGALQEEHNPGRNFTLEVISNLATYKLVESRVPGLGKVYLAGKMAQEMEPIVDRFLETAHRDDFTPAPSSNPHFMALGRPGLLDTDVEPVLAANTLKVMLNVPQIPARALSGIQGEVVHAANTMCNEIGLTDANIARVGRELLVAYGQLPPVMP